MRSGTTFLADLRGLNPPTQASARVYRRLVRFLIVLLVACAPQIDGPLERQRALDRDDSARLAAQLAQLPGAVRADVTLHRPTVDPLSETVTPASAAVLIVVDDKADRRALERSAVSLVRGTAPEIAEPAIVVEVGAVRPELATVGPFSVEARSKPRIIAAFGIALSLIAALAGFVAWRERFRIPRR
jgi:type III secretory pathway lipoprotein EscJ